jgi:hypothetical protein
MEAIGPASEQTASWLTLYAMWKGAFALNLSSNLSLMSGWAKALNAWCVFATLLLVLGCKGAPEPGELDSVEARLSTLRDNPEIAWVEKHPPATILIGWKKHPVEGFSAVNRMAAEQASRIARGVRIVSIRDFQKTMWHQVTPLCESTTTGDRKFTTTCP